MQPEENSSNALQGSALALVLYDVCEEIRLEELRALRAAERQRPALKRPAAEQAAKRSRMSPNFDPICNSHQQFCISSRRPALQSIEARKQSAAASRTPESNQMKADIDLDVEGKTIATGLLPDLHCA